jgi:hypothetical protein
MDLSPWKATSFSGTEEFPNILWNPNVHYRIHKSPPLVKSRTRWMQPTPPHPISPKQILISSSHLRLCLPSGLFPSGFPTKILYYWIPWTVCNYIRFKVLAVVIITAVIFWIGLFQILSTSTLKMEAACSSERSVSAHRNYTVSHPIILKITFERHYFHR